MADSTFGAQKVDKISNDPRESEGKTYQLLSSDQERSLMFERMAAKIDALIAEVAAWNPAYSTEQVRYPMMARYPEVSRENSRALGT